MTDLVGDAHDPAGIQYVGLPGISADCEAAILRLLQYGDRVSRARILSNSGTHCMLLTVGEGDLVAVKSGFGSGYGGEGPHALSSVLQVLEAYRTEIDEIVVDPELLDHVDNSALTTSDLALIETARPVRPSRWREYVTGEHCFGDRAASVWHRFPPVIPFAIIDPRLEDLVIAFWSHTDSKLLRAYRRLEDVVRKRTALDEHGAKLFSQAFLGDASKLSWPECGSKEQVARANLFVAVYGAFRNPRAHHESVGSEQEQLSEFLMLNQLFLLEQQAVDRAEGHHAE